MKLIIFDIDGTLCHSKYVDDKCFLKAFETVLGKNIRNTNWDSYNHATELHITKQILKDLKSNSDNSTINDIINVYTNEIQSAMMKSENSFMAIPGAKQLFEYLIHNSEFKVGIATGGFLKPALFKLNALGFNFRNITIFSSDNFSTKFEMISQLIEEYKANNRILEFQKVFYIGDREYDYNTTTELGIDFIGIDYDMNNRLKEIGVTKVLNDFEPMEKFLEFI